MRKATRSLWFGLALGLLAAVAACSDPMAIEHTTSSGNHTTSSGNLRQGRFQLPESARDVSRSLDHAAGAR
jgi:hypothetical protein